MSLHVDDDEDDEASARRLGPADAGDMSAAVRCQGMALAAGLLRLLLVVAKGFSSLVWLCFSSGFNFLLRLGARNSASCPVQAGWL